MNIEVVTENSYARKVEVTVPAEAVQRALDNAFKTYERRASLPGFRKGRVPRKVLEARFGNGIAEEVADSLVQEGWAEVLSSHGIEPVAQPELVARGTVAPRTEFRFTIGVQVKPEVVVENYRGLEVEWPEMAVTEELVDRAVEERRASQSRLVAVEGRPVQEGDTVQVSLKAEIDGELVVDEPGTLVRTSGDAWLKGVESFLLGLSVDEEKSGEVTFDDEARNDDVAGETAQVTAQVIAIQAMQVPDLDDALAEELGHESVEALRASVRASLEEGRDEQARNQARANALEALIAANDIEVPQGMVQQNLEMLKQELQYQAAWRGEDPRNVQFSDAHLAQLHQRAVFATKGGLLIEALWTAENIEATEEMLADRIAEMAEERGQSPEAIRGLLAEDGNLDDFRERLREEAAIDWLLDHAKITKVDPSKAVAASPSAPAAQADAGAAEASPSDVESSAGQAEASPADAEASPGDAEALLSLSIGDLKTALKTGAHDRDIDALLDAEAAGRNRKGALAALRSRLS